MATKVELSINQVREALEQKIASIKRASNTAKNPEFKELYDRDLREYQKGLMTLTETK